MVAAAIGGRRRAFSASSAFHLLLPRIATMRIAQVAPIYEAVPPLRYGGTERIVSYITEGLVRRGHDVTLFASGDSRTAARLVPVAPRAQRLDPASRDRISTAMVCALDRVFGHADDFDVIHCHVDYPAFPFARFVATPTLHTLHGRLDSPELECVFSQFGKVPLISISDAQREPLDRFGVTWEATVHHGVALEEFPFVERRGSYLAFLGRVSPEKKPDVAIEVARRVGLPLRIAAKIDASDEPYFEEVVEPLLDDPLVTYVGEISQEKKAAFLGGAAALLFPIDWPEPFGLVMIEAMACGTPVIARSRGSVPEVVVPGVSGYIAETVDDFAAAIQRLDAIDRAACRRYVEERFTVERMVEDYEAVYRRVARTSRAA
jgi:glycosyltransferase involved in cell wall biosynthesis